ncbi:MAG: hypothetical protein IKF60_05390 [Solobacterium sp.]|nr:hypothetical protein [Solobacterium sp.]MBR3203001.1 hypothetical protein [Solobacterium sp.]
MTVGDLIFYVLDAAILFMLYRMYQASKTIEIKTSVGPRWVIPAMFWAIALLGLFNYRGAFRIIQTIALAVMGAIYWTFDSGLSKKGLVMIGRLYPYEKIKPITVDEANHCVNFTIRKVPTAIFFLPEQMRDVQNYLSHHAGVAKRAAKARTKTAPAKPKEEDKKKAEA